MLQRLCEFLEGRRLLSHGAFAITTVWQISGDLQRKNLNDSIVIEADPFRRGTLRAMVNGVVASRHAVRGLRTIRINAGRGNDAVTMNLPAAALAVKALINGGLGNDVLAGGGEADSIWGGPGSDTISGGAGRDFISGGDGNDQLYGDDGDDQVLGDANDDIVMGGAGDDTVRGGAGDDQVDGGDGVNTILGDAGNDILVSLTDGDLCLGGKGVNQIFRPFAQ